MRKIGNEKYSQSDQHLVDKSNIEESTAPSHPAKLKTVTSASSFSSKYTKDLNQMIVDIKQKYLNDVPSSKAE